MRTTAPVVLIGGPTASGKSALGLKIARERDGVVVNADSMQLYRDLPILTARPGPEDEALAPHALYGVADPRETWSTGRWLRAVLPVLETARADGRPAIVVGGTGLYFRALVVGLADMPEASDSVRQETGALYDRLGEAAFRERLAAVDPAAERRIERGDRQRLTRAFEVHAATGRAISDWQARTRPALPPEDWEGVVVEPERATLHARCDARFDAMLESGALDEVRALASRGFSDDWPIARVLGAPELLAVVEGRADLKTAAAQAKARTRQYAKRQSTWFRNQCADWRRIGVD